MLRGIGEKGRGGEIGHEWTQPPPWQRTDAAFWPQPGASSPAAYWIPYLSITVFPAKENSAGSNYCGEPVNFILGAGVGGLGERWGSFSSSPPSPPSPPHGACHSGSDRGCRPILRPPLHQGQAEETMDGQRGRRTSTSSTPVMSPVSLSPTQGPDEQTHYSTASGRGAAGPQDDSPLGPHLSPSFGLSTVTLTLITLWFFFPPRKPFILFSMKSRHIRFPCTATKSEPLYSSLFWML